MFKAILIMFFIFLGFTDSTYASSQDECAIWLCLPAGFPAGCSAAHAEFKKRIKKGRPPLPYLSSCTKGPDVRVSKGRYEMGNEYFEPCKEGYTLRQTSYELSAGALCERKDCGNIRKENCFAQDNYQAIRRPKPSYVKIWVDEEYLGQFFY